MHRMTWAFVLMAFVAVACATERPSPEAEAHAIESQVWSPYCPGQLLIDCTTPQARELRAEIQRRLVAGEAPREVLAWISVNHGPEALAQPLDGPRLLLWLVPGAVFLAGGIVTGGVVRRWLRARSVPSSAAPAPPPPGRALDRAEVLRRIREEVERGL
jgi:cytochrome c-type biogenesis protein CcmH/NrfF